MKELSKTQKRIIISSVVVLLVISIGVSGFFLWKNQHKNTSIQTETSSDEVEALTVESTETTEESSTTETTTKETTTKKAAAPVTKPYKPKQTTSTKKPSVASKTVKLKVQMVSQLPNYPTGCEAASATMLLRYYNYNVSLDEMIAAIPREDLYEENGRVYGPSIYEKFVGDPRQTYTDEKPGYGAFSPVVTRALNNVLLRHNGKHIAKNITGCSFNNLIKNLDEGNPVIVWATAKMKTPQYVNSWYIKSADGKETYFEYPRGTHVTVLVGYDSQYIYMADPYFGNLKFKHTAFIDKWELLGKQAIVLVGGTPTVETSTTEIATNEELTTTTTTTTETSTEEITTLIESSTIITTETDTTETTTDSESSTEASSADKNDNEDDM